MNSTIIAPGFIHLGFDILATLLALISGLLVYRWRLFKQLPLTAQQIDKYYFIYLGFGSVAGAYLFGTANLWLSGEQAIGRSILGALTIATAAVELYKWRRGIEQSTGYIYVVPLCVCIILGRLGCFYSGLDDFTHGIPTEVAWARDYGDGIPRHPVQLYESFSMVLFLSFFLILLRFGPNFVFHSGYYLFAGFYAAQRFAWEFFKPYETLFLGLNIFHLLCLLLVAYSISMIMRTVKYKSRYETGIA